MADTSKEGPSRAKAQQPKARAPPRTPGTPSGGPRPARGRPEGGAGAVAHTHGGPPRIGMVHPPTVPPPGQMMAYPQQHPQHPQHPQYPQRMGPPGMAFQHPHPPPPPPPPPAFFPGSASLFEQLDKRVMVVLRDGRHLVGVMRSYDQFSNIVLEDTHERHFVGDMFGDIALGLYLVRGDALVLMGELDPALEETPRLKKVSADEIIEAQQEASAEERQDAKLDWLFQDLS
eukprot:g11232.t1